LPSAVGSLDAEGALLALLHAEVDVEACECVIDLLDGGALHGCIVSGRGANVKSAGKI
jgi:hypothetical protein